LAYNKSEAFDEIAALDTLKLKTGRYRFVEADGIGLLLLTGMRVEELANLVAGMQLQFSTVSNFYEFYRLDSWV
jgi:hypothetical protein